MDRLLVRREQPLERLHRANPHRRFHPRGPVRLPESLHGHLHPVRPLLARDPSDLSFRRPLLRMEHGRRAGHRPPSCRCEDDPALARRSPVTFKASKVVCSCRFSRRSHSPFADQFVHVRRVGPSDAAPSSRPRAGCIRDCPPGASAEPPALSRGHRGASRVLVLGRRRHGLADVLRSALGSGRAEPRSMVCPGARRDSWPVAILVASGDSPRLIANRATGLQPTLALRWPDRSALRQRDGARLRAAESRSCLRRRRSRARCPRPEGIKTRARRATACGDGPRLESFRRARDRIFPEGSGSVVHRSDDSVLARPRGSPRRRAAFHRDRGLRNHRGGSSLFEPHLGRQILLPPVAFAGFGRVSSRVAYDGRRLSRSSLPVGRHQSRRGGGSWRAARTPTALGFLVAPHVPPAGRHRRGTRGR